MSPASPVSGPHNSFRDLGLRVGQEVAVPYVEDEVLMATLEAPKPAAVVGAVGANGADGAGSAKELGSLLGAASTKITRLVASSSSNPTGSTPRVRRYPSPSQGS